MSLGGQNAKEVVEWEEAENKNVSPLPLQGETALHLYFDFGSSVKLNEGKSFRKVKNLLETNPNEWPS